MCVARQDNNTNVLVPAHRKVRNALLSTLSALVPQPQEVDAHLGDICGRVHDALPPRLARAVCAVLVGAVQSVLLDGGPFRWLAVAVCVCGQGRSPSGAAAGRLGKCMLAADALRCWLR